MKIIVRILIAVVALATIAIWYFNFQNGSIGGITKPIAAFFAGHKSDAPGSPAATSSTNGGRPITVYAKRTVSVRNTPSTIGNSPIGNLNRGDSVIGILVKAADGNSWLKITEEPYAGGYVWAKSISQLTRPILTTTIHKRLTISIPIDVMSEPHENSDVLYHLGSGKKVSILVLGYTFDGWAEVELESGLIGYVREAVFDYDVPTNYGENTPSAAAIPPTKVSVVKTFGTFGVVI